ncbi:MAG: BLUF domain-containing protein [Pseudomonadota bacterium]|nr:BLUF domain-containing protein [Pseudomonadota bacterium]
MAVRQVIYLSSAVRQMTADELDSLLRVTRTRNAGRGITGLLLYGEGSFLQVLEGDPDTIAEVFDTIRRDPRHSGLIKVSDATVADRKFGEWSMAWRRIDTAPEDLRDSFRNLRDGILENVDAVSRRDVVDFMVGSFLDSQPQAQRNRN